MLAILRQAGNQVSLVAGKNVYTLEGHEVELDKYAAQKVTVKGTLKGETLTVESVLSSEVTQITTGSIRRRLCPAVLRFLLSR